MDNCESLKLEGFANKISFGFFYTLFLHRYLSPIAMAFIGILFLLFAYETHKLLLNQRDASNATVVPRSWVTWEGKRCALFSSSDYTPKVLAYLE